MDFVPFELKNIIEYIPFCIIIVIILISTLTWNVLTDKIHYLVTLIAIFIWAIYLYIGDSKSLWEWSQTNNTNPNQGYIFPKPAAGAVGGILWQNSQGGIWNMHWIANKIPYYKGTLLGLIVCIVIIAIGLALGTNIKDSDKKMPINDGATFTGIGSFITAVSIIAGIFVIISLFKDGISNDKKNAIITPVSLIGLAVGIYLIVTGKNIDQNMKDGNPIDTTKVVNVNMQEIKLGFGLFMQISAILGLLLIFFKNGWLHDFDTTTTPNIITIGLRYVLIITLCLTGISLTAISSDKDTGDVKSYLSHGVTYLILGFIALILCGGGLIKFTTYVVAGIFLLFILFSLFCWNWDRIRVELERIRDYSDINKISQNSDKKNSFYIQIRDEAIAEYKKEKRGDVVIDSNGNISTTNINGVKADVDSKITDRLIKMKNREEPNLVLNIFIILISLILVFATAYFRYIKYKITNAKNLPRESDPWWNIFKFLSDLNDFTGVNYQLPAVAPPRPIPNFPNNDKYFAHDKIDNLTGNDWNDVVSLKNDHGVAQNNELDFSTGVVYAASASRWNMFISIILIVMWVLAVYAHIISSDKTEAWIATSFDVTMFSKIKELISAFFFTIITALAIAAILLIPAVKEFNTDAVDNLLKFAESIQVWQWDEVQSNNVDWWKWIIGIIVYILIILIFILPVVLPFLNDPKNTDNDKLPGGIKAYIVIVCLFFWFFKSAFASFFAGTVVDGYKLESGIIRFFRSILTSFYLIPLFGLSVLKFIIFGLVWFFTLFQFDDIKNAASNSGKTMMSIFFGVGIPGIGVEGLKSDTDLRFFKNMFNTDSAPPTAADVSTVAPRPVPVPAPSPSNQAAISIDQTKVSVVTKLIKTIIIIVCCIMVVLTIVYGFYQLKQKSFTSTGSAGSDGTTTTTTSSTSGIDTATSTFMYIVFILIGIAGGVAFIRDRAAKSGVENPEKLIFDDYHPEDEKSPARQLTFAMIHIIYVALMIIVWVYDREVDKQNKMSVIGMSILGIFIILFHYCLEIIDTPDDTTGPGPGMLSRLFENIRFLANSVFLILICVLLYYKMHALMAALIVVMFMFHLSKSKIGLVLLKLIWLCIIYIPCMILDAIVGGKNMIGATTRPIWIILAVEVILLALIAGGPYLINKIGASKSQIILAPVPLMRLNDTKLTTESSEIFIYHNTGMNRSANDASCPPEEKKRYNYSVSGWFWINGSVTNKDADLAILDFAGVPKITYNPFKTSFKVTCKTLGTDGTVSENGKPKIIYESRNNSLENDSEYKEMVMANNLQISKHIPLQKWTYFVINYDGKTIDIFLNDELVGKSDFIMPNITVERITSGQSEDGTGLNGNICNVVFSKTPMTAEHIRRTYNTLKTLDPPLIGTKTVVDEINSVGKTDVYSK
jgi:hypothetical protein